VRHHEAWLFFALLKALSGEDISAAEVSRHFNMSSVEKRATSVSFSPPICEEGRLIGCYELTAIDLMGLATAKAPAISGRILYMANGVMAATVKLLVSGAENSSVCHSGEWRTTGGDKSSHVLHWSRCNLHAAHADPVIDCADKPGNYFGTRVRAIDFSADGQDLTLTTPDGLSLHWRRAPECDWTQSESVGVSDQALCGALVRSLPGDNQTFAQRLFKANAAMQMLVSGFVEPAEEDSA